MDFKFSEDQQAIIEAVKEFVACEIAPHVEEIQANDQPPKDLFKKAGEAGILGIAFPEAYGGLGQSYETLTAAYKEIAKVAPGSVISFSTTAAVSNILRHYGTEEQKEKYIRPAINGEIVTSMAFTESETGSDPKQLRTIAQEDGTDIIRPHERVQRGALHAGFPSGAPHRGRVRRAAAYHRPLFYRAGEVKFPHPDTSPREGQENLRHGLRYPSGALCFTPW